MTDDYSDLTVSARAAMTDDKITPDAMDRLIAESMAEAEQELRSKVACHLLGRPVTVGDFLDRIAALAARLAEVEGAYKASRDETFRASCFSCEETKRADAAEARVAEFEAAADGDALTVAHLKGHADGRRDAAAKLVMAREAVRDLLWSLDNAAAILSSHGLESTMADPRPEARATLAELDAAPATATTDDRGTTEQEKNP
jgi:hypothetical protein